MLLRTLVIARPAPVRKRLERLCASPEVLLSTPDARAGFWQAVRGQSNDLIVAGRSVLPAPLDDTVRSIRELPDQPELIVVSDREDAEERASLLTLGCLAVLYQGLPDEVLGETLAALLRRRREEALSRLGLGPVDAFRLTDFATSSPAMVSFLGTVKKVIDTDTSLLITGETGVGKERLASAIHKESHRSSGPFVAVNCGALSEGLLESELFGHEEGAFTGAIRARRGYFELAHRGTIFLDEIGEMPPALQVKLLRVLQERLIQRLGGERAIPIDVRVMAATNRDLTEEVKARRFRQDLYYRLGVVTLAIPALRERVEDVSVLADSYVQYFRRKLRRDVEGLTPEAVRALQAYPWPGNVRELINVIERAMLLCSGREVTLADLPHHVSGAVPELRPTPRRGEPDALTISAAGWLDRPWKQAREHALAAFERTYLDGVLRATGGRIGETARRAGMDARSLHEKMRRHGLRKEDYRGPTS